MARTKVFTLPVVVSGYTHNVIVERSNKGHQVSVDGQMPMFYPLTFTDQFFGAQCDLPIQVAGVNFLVVVRKEKYRLAADGRYIDNGEAFEPARPLPGWSWVFVVLNLLIPFISLGGVLNILFGLGGASISAMVARSKIKSTTGKVFACIGVTAVAYAVWIAFTLLLASLLY